VLFLMCDLLALTGYCKLISFYFDIFNQPAKGDANVPNRIMCPTKCGRLGTIPKRDRQKDRHTDGQTGFFLLLCAMQH